MGWDFDDNDKDKLEFTKFPEGITNIRIVGESPHKRWGHWITKQSRMITCPGFKECPICQIRAQQKANKQESTYNMAKRMTIWVINRNTGKLEILEQGVTFFQDVKDLMEDLKAKKKNLIDVDITVRRRGTGKDGTSYRLDIGDEYPLTKEDLSLIEDLTPMTDIFQEHNAEQITKIINGEDWNDVMYPDNNSDDDDEVVLK